MSAGNVYYAMEEPTSLNVLDILPELYRAGVAAIKVEGRQRSPAYVAQVTRTLREAIDACVADPETFSPEVRWVDTARQCRRRTLPHARRLFPAMAMKLSLGPIPYFWEREQRVRFLRACRRSAGGYRLSGRDGLFQAPRPASAGLARHRRASDRRGQGAGTVDAHADRGRIGNFPYAHDRRKRPLSRSRPMTWRRSHAGACCAIRYRSACQCLQQPYARSDGARRRPALGDAGGTRPRNAGRAPVERPAGLETEVFVFGRLPLSFSARCFTARAHNLPKDECGFRCADYPEGMPLQTREGQSFLNLNGIQVQSGETCNLVERNRGTAGARRGCTAACAPVTGYVRDHRRFPPRHGRATGIVCRGRDARAISNGRILRTATGTVRRACTSSACPMIESSG